MKHCKEKKLTLSGGILIFECELLHLDEDLGVLKYVIDRPYDVCGIHLRSGDVTYAFYWTGRPYTLYLWRMSGNRSVHYFNIADGISLTPDEFAWRDLAVDVLIDPDLTAHVLDEHELPDTISPELLSFIDRAKTAVLKDYPRIMHEAHAFLLNTQDFKPDKKSI